MYNSTYLILFLFLGGLFDMTDTIQEIAFRYAVDRVNSDREIMPRSRLAAQIERIPKQDSFYASKQGKGPFINYVSTFIGFLGPLSPPMQGQLQIWTEHSTLIFENLKPVEKSKNHFSIN